MRGHVTIVQLLIDHGADANAADPSQWSALMTAAVNGFDNVV